MPTAAKTRASKFTIGTLIDAMWQLREQKKELEARIKKLDEEFDALDLKLQEQLDAAGLEQAVGANARVSYSFTTVGTIEDFDALWAYARKNNYGHLFQRRLSDVAYRELLEAGKTVPGVQPFTKKRINLRANPA